MSRPRWRTATAALAAAAGAVVIAPCRSSPALPASPPVVAVTMSEYRFAFDPAIGAGRTVFRAANDGKVDHELALVVLPGDYPERIADQLRSSRRRAVATRAFLPPRPSGASGTFAVDLVPSRYALMCFVPAPDGEAHALKGMTAEFTVR